MTAPFKPSRTVIGGLILACFFVAVFSVALAAAPKEKAKSEKKTLIEEPFIAEVEKVFKVDDQWCVSFVERGFVLHIGDGSRVVDERGASMALKEAPELLSGRALRVTMTRDELGRYMARELVVLSADRLFELRRSEAAKPRVFRGVKDAKVVR